MGQILVAEALGEAGKHLFGTAGHWAIPAALVLQAVRAAGMAKQSDLLGAAVRDPALAQQLLAKAATRRDAAKIQSRNLGANIARVAMSNDVEQVRRR